MRLGSLLKSIPAYFHPNYGSLNEIVNQSGDEKVVIALAQLVQEPRKCTAKPVAFLIDQCNSFHANPETIKLYSDSVKVQVASDENPVGAMFLDWNTFNVNRGDIFLDFRLRFS
jgi:hypothetical protein